MGMLCNLLARQSVQGGERKTCAPTPIQTEQTRAREVWRAFACVHMRARVCPCVSVCQYVWLGLQQALNVVSPAMAACSIAILMVCIDRFLVGQVRPNTSMPVCMGVGRLYVCVCVRVYVCTRRRFAWQAWDPYEKAPLTEDGCMCFAHRATCEF